MLEYSILGSLNYKPMFGYELKQTMESSTLFFWNAKLSQIYITLKKLEKEKKLTSKVKNQKDKPDRKIYTITELGKKSLTEWLKDPVTEFSEIKDTLLLKLYFSSKLDKNEIILNLLIQKKLHTERLKHYKEVSAQEIKNTVREYPQFKKDAILWEATRKRGEIYEKSYIQWIDETIQLIKKIFSFSLIVLFQFCSIQTKEEGIKKIEDQFQKIFGEMKYSKSANLLVHSDKLKINLHKSIGFIDSENKIPAQPNQAFHTASIGKTFTSSLIFQLIEEKKINLNDKINKFLDEKILKDLFVFEGKDYSSEVSIDNLLTHKSGINDYLESSSNNPNSMLNKIISEPNHFWTPEEILNYTRKNLKAVSKPNEKFFYSDTGYILLGLILEKIEKKPFEEILKIRILKPFQLNQTYMYFRSEPIEKKTNPVSRMFLGEKDVTGFKSISMDWAGGGLISTTEDLFKFQKALVDGKIISKENLKSMEGNEHFHAMIYYGKGLMSLKLNEVSFLIPKLPILYGHSGLLSTLMFYIPEYDTYIITNFGSTSDIEKSFEMLVWITLTLKEMNQLKN